MFLRLFTEFEGFWQFDDGDIIDCPVIVVFFVIESSLRRLRQFASFGRGSVHAPG